MDDLDLPNDITEGIDVIYLDEDEEVEEIDEFDGEMNAENGIEAEIVDLAKLTFRKHKGSVFICDISSNGRMAVTGGEDDMAYLWDLETGDVLLDCTGHKDSVTELSFSFDNQYIATGDMGGLIQVWEVKTKKLIWCYEGDDLEWMFWHTAANILVTGTQSGDTYIFQIPSGNCKVLPSHGALATCGKLMIDGKRLLTGYSDGQIKLWDIKNAAVVWQYTNPNMQGINSLEINSDGTLICACPSGELIKASDGKLLKIMLAEGESELEVCKFNSELGILASGSLSGQICVWEMGRNVLRHEAKIECEVTIMQFAKNGKLVVGATDGAVYVCDTRSGQLLETLTGHHDGILSLCVSHDGEFILSTSDDGTAKKFLLAQ